MEVEKRELRRQIMRYRQLLQELESSDAPTNEMMREYVSSLEHQLREMKE